MHHPEPLAPSRALLWLPATLFLASPTVLAHDLDALVAAGDGAVADAVRKVAGDFRFTEGPAWSPDGFLLFSDIPNDRIVRLDDGGIRDFMKPSGRANGLAFDPAGRLYICQGGERRLALLGRDGELEVLAGSWGGKKLNSPNDLALDALGGVYFTDPRYGASDDVEQPAMGVYYVDAGARVRRVIDDLQRPNGILVSADGSRLFVAEPDRRELYRYTIESPGEVSERTVIFTGDETTDGGGPDGMTLDEHGHIYATYRSVVVLEPDGKLVGRIPVPEHPANCGFGGKDGKTLYITARTSLYSVAMRVGGAPMAGGLTTTGRREVKAGQLSLKIPPSWKASAPTNSMRLAEIEVPAAGGDSAPGELIVYYFGASGAGGARANIERWIQQFAPDGRTTRIVRGKSEAGAYVLLDQSGTYRKPIGPPIRRQSRDVPGSRMLAVVLERPDGAHYLKFTGPETTVEASAEDFRAAFGADATSEEVVELDDL